MTGQGLQARLRRLCPPCQASKGCVHCCKGCQMATKAVSTAPRTLQYLRREHCCIGVATEVRQPSCTACKCQTSTAAHLMVYKCWCTSRPKLPFLPQRGEAQAWSLARSLSRLQWLASNPCHKRATGRALGTGCCPLLQDLLPTSSQLTILASSSKKGSTLQSLICWNNKQKQQSELLRYLAKQAYCEISKSCCSNCLCGALLLRRGFEMGRSKCRRGPQLGALTSRVRLPHPDPPRAEGIPGQNVEAFDFDRLQHFCVSDLLKRSKYLKAPVKVICFQARTGVVSRGLRSSFYAVRKALHLKINMRLAFQHLLPERVDRTAAKCTTRTGFWGVYSSLGSHTGIIFDRAALVNAIYISTACWSFPRTSG